VVKFKVLKYKHYREANRLRQSQDVSDDEVMHYILELVDAWDFVDAETGEALPPNPEALDELSLEQVQELSVLFERAMGMNATVPKENA